MLGTRIDLPFRRDQASRFLPWLIALMVYLAALAVGVSVVLGSAADNWRNDLSGNMTVEVPPVLHTPDAAQATDARVARAVEILLALPATRSAEPISEAEGLRLLEPWIGSGDIAIDLPLPRLIDLQVDPGAASKAESIRAALEGEVPGVRVDDHGRWVGRLLALIRSIEAIAMAVVLLIGAASVLAVVFVTQTGLAVHNDVIEVLHLVGARDRYIAGQFQRHALNQAARGTLAGTLLALVTILGLSLIGAPADLPLLPTMRLGIDGWLALAAVPLAALAIAALTARMTVLRALHRMP
ncbi:MAG: cell division protein [Proteobacteria bacterium]|nr:cell division protein [Pseudomonadota bacterium]